jgi:hypothetical protein
MCKKRRRDKYVMIVCIVCGFQGLAKDHGDIVVPESHEGCKTLRQQAQRRKYNKTAKNTGEFLCSVCNETKPITTKSPTTGFCLECDKSIGIRVLDIKPRTCLTCGKYFKSQGKHNRRCPRCTELWDRAIVPINAHKVSRGGDGEVYA